MCFNWFFSSQKFFEHGVFKRWRDLETAYLSEVMAQIVERVHSEEMAQILSLYNIDVKPAFARLIQIIDQVTEFPWRAIRITEIRFLIRLWVLILVIAFLPLFFELSFI